LDGGTYNRSYEDESVPENEGVDTGNNLITFNGQTDSGFTLEKANYTAGEAARFVGAPEIFYTTLEGRQNWNQQSKWSLTDDGVDDGNTGVPGVGDVAVIKSYGNSNQNHWVNANIDLTISELVFDNSLGGWNPRLWVTRRNASLNLGPVSGVGTIYLEVTAVQTPTFNGATDLGSYAREANSFFVYRIDADNQTVDMINNIPEYPNLRIEAGNGNGDDNNRILQTSIPITINQDVRMDRSPRWRINHDVSIARNLRVTWQANRTTVEIGDDREVTLEIGNDLRMENGNGNDGARFLVKNDNLNGYRHKVRVGGDIEFEGNLDGSSEFDLYNGTGNNNNAILELTGTGNFTFSNNSTASLTPDLYRVVMNKEAGTATSFSFNNIINLPTPATIEEQPVEVLNGLLILNDAGIDVNLTDEDRGNFLLPNTNNPEASSGSGGLEIAAGTVRIEGDDTGMLLDGLLRVSGGTLDMAPVAGNGNNFVEISSSGNAQMEISDGTLDIGGQVRRATANTTGVLSYRQTGGTVNIATRNGSAEPARGIFEVMNLGSEFTHTGGALKFFNSNNSANVPSVRLEPTTGHTDGSVITFGNTTGDTNMGIKSAIALNRIELIGTSNPTVKIYELPLVLDSLTINADNTFDANGFGLTFQGGSLINNGTFTSSGDVFNQQTTTFNSSDVQEIRGSGISNFWRLTKTGSDSLYLVDQNITVQDNLRLETGVFETKDNAVIVLGDVLNDARHSSAAPTGSGPRPQLGIVMAGTEKQRLLRSVSGTSYFGTLSIENPNGVIIEDETFYTFQADQALVLRDGVLDISSNLFVIGPNATVQNAFGNSGRDDFNVNNMVQTNSTFQDFGLRKIFNNGVETDFVWPVGQGAYTPVVLDMTAALNTTGTTGHITIRPSNEPHPTVNDHDNTVLDPDSPGEIIDRNNVLQYHWIIKSEGIDALTANLELIYDDSHVSLDNNGVTHADGPFDESNYAAARLLFNGNVWDKAYDQASVNEGDNIIIFDNSVFSGAGIGDADITGDYTAGLLLKDDGSYLEVGAIPNRVPEYESRNFTGLYASGSDWTGLNGTPNLLPGESPVGAILYIRSGDDMRINTANSRIYRTIIEEGATLELTDAALNTRLGIVEGTGTLKLTNTTPGQAIQLPAGYYEDFFTCNGGRIEYSGSVDYKVLAGLVEVRGVTFSGLGDREFSNTDITVCEDLILRDNVSITNTFGRDITVRGNVIKSDNSTATLQPFIGGSATLTLDGTSAQEIRGYFTGSSAIYNLRINNNSGVSIVNTAEPGITANGDVEVSNLLTLSNGLVTTDVDNSLKILADADVSGGGNFAYVNGPLVREMRNGSGSYRFPIGTASRYGRIDLENPRDIDTPSGIKDWTATYYYDLNPYELFTMTADAQTAGVEKASTWEYWNLDAISPASANVRPYWGADSDVTDLSHLRVIYWDEDYAPSAAWEVLPEVSAPTGSSASGNLSAGPLSFSTKTVTFGTINQSITLLPVELLYFRGEARDNGNLLFWATASEVDNAYFEVLRSDNGRDFEPIGKVDPKGGVEQMAEYRFIDRDAKTGTTYYMLKQVDKDGNYANSEVIAIKYERLGKAEVELSVFPNPVTAEEFELLGEYWQPDRRLHYKIMDVTGSLLKMGGVDIDANGIVQHQVKLPENLSTGVYILFASDGNNQKSIKIMIE